MRGHDLYLLLVLVFISITGTERSLWRSCLWRSEGAGWRGRRGRSWFGSTPVSGRAGSLAFRCIPLKCNVVPLRKLPTETAQLRQAAHKSHVWTTWFTSWRDSCPRDFIPRPTAGLRGPISSWRSMVAPWHRALPRGVKYALNSIGMRFGVSGPTRLYWPSCWPQGHSKIYHFSSTLAPFSPCTTQQQLLVSCAQYSRTINL